MSAHALTSGRLLEREAELDELRSAVRGCSTKGRVVAISGPPGSGKTALLDAACRLASDAGVEAYRCRGSELEQGFAFGATRQLFERPLALLDDAAAGRLRDGAGARGWETIDGSETSPTPDAFAALHGLYWLFTGMVEDRPAMIAVDDAQWLDNPSLRWLEYLSHRIAELPVLVVLTAWQPDSGMALELRRLLADPETRNVQPRPLSIEAIAQLIVLRLGIAPSRGFLVACEQATAGNPFVLQELIDELVADDIAPSDEATGRLASRAPAAVAQSLLIRLERLGPEAGAIARALAVCGDETPLQLLASISGLGVDSADDAIDRLTIADLVKPERPPRFVHGLIRGAIETALPARELAALHRRCAETLQLAGGDPEAIAVHWLAVDPAGSPTVVDQLRLAAARALSRGGTDSAVRYLRRALLECVEPAPGLLRELGVAELGARDPACAARLQAALELEPDPRGRAEVGIGLIDALIFTGRWDDSLELVDRLRAELDDADPLSFALDAFLAGSLMNGSPREQPQDLDRLFQRATRSGSPARSLSMQIACVLAQRGTRLDEVVTLVERGYGDGAFFESHTSDSTALTTAVMALMFVGRYEQAHEITEGMLADARRRGLVLGHIAAATHRGLVAQRMGDLHDAEADLRDALALALEHGLVFTLPFIAAYLAATLLDRGQIQEASTILGQVAPPDPDIFRLGAIAFFETRGLARTATGDLDGAIADLRSAGAASLATQIANPLASRWRSRLALALGANTEALTLGRVELEQAQAVGVDLGIGLATYALAVIGATDHREDRLRAALSYLETGPLRLDHARARIDLGTVLRLRGEHGEARQHLLLGMDLADRCGATQLAQRAREEAVAVGARPRRARLSGADALTPAELRVARLAAQGMTNRQIAQALFVTAGTVKDHLGSSYRKLEISSRDQLGGKLRPPGPRHSSG
jgi:DNA-binding CsgD family transcriptional regulator/RecA/RadA recombinase